MNSDMLRERGKRLKLLISMTGLEIVNLAQITGIGISTLRNWINGRLSGLSEKGARKVCQFFLRYNIQCDLNWLMYGKGNYPSFSQTVYGRAPASSLYNHDNDYLIEERELFLSRYPGSIVALVQDDAMKPLFEPEDHVGGILLNEGQLEKAIGKNCIIKTQHDEIFIGKITCGMAENLYTLHQLNLESSCFPLVRPDLQVKGIAPIVRVWRQSFSFE